MPVYAASLLTPALHLSQSTLHVPVPLEGGQQCTKCGKLYFDTVSFLARELNTTLSAQSAALVSAGAGDPDSAAAPSDLLPLLRLQLLLQRLLVTALHQLTLWVASRSQLLLTQWQTSAYFLITMADLPRCIQLVDSLQVRQGRGVDGDVAVLVVLESVTGSFIDRQITVIHNQYTPFTL